MAENSKIEWTHHTANLWHGCTKVHEGCDHCYAETLSKRWKRDIWGNDKPRMEIKSAFSDLDKYQRLAEEASEVHRVFIGSMMDIFEKPMPLVDSKGNERLYTTDKLRWLLFFNIDAGKYPNLMLLFLTKRPSNINKYIPENWKTNPPANVMFGTSPVNQSTAETLIRQLNQVNGRRFLSVEPMLGRIDLDYIDTSGIDWIICGGESGHLARPMHPVWAIDLKDQSRKRGIPFLFKQWGEWLPKDQLSDNMVEADKAYIVKYRNDGKYVRLGKKQSGRLLDGQEYNEFPKEPSNQNQ